MSGVTLLPSEMDPEQRIDELHAWIATHANGGEGIIACMLPGLGTTPMVSARRRAMEQAEPLVRRTAALGQGPDEIVELNLVTFRRIVVGSA